MVNAIQVLQTVKYFTEQAESTEKLLRLGILRGGVQGKVRLDKQLKKMILKERQIMKKQGQYVFQRWW